MKRTNAICVFNAIIDNSTYGSAYEEYVYGYGLDSSRTEGRDPGLIEFVKELLTDFPERYFDTESLLNDVGYQCVFIEGTPEQNKIDFNILIKKALERGFYVTDETNGEIYTPKKKNAL